MSDGPLISVLLPVYNAIATIDEALFSLASQTEPDFEVIIVDDGSTDETPARLVEWAARDCRLQVVRQEKAGLPAALNHAFCLSSGRYLARMDADDVSLPRRFERQSWFLDQNPAVGLCGTWIETFGVGRRLVVRYPEGDGAIRARMVFETPFAHPAVMCRRSVFDGLTPVYRDEFPRAQDYDLWERLRGRCVFANLPEVLLRYRVHAGQSTVTDRVGMLTGAGRVRARLIDGWCPSATEEDKLFHNALCTGGLPCRMDSLEAAERWLLRLSAEHGLKNQVDDGVWRAALAVKWWEVCIQFEPLGVCMLISFVRSPLLQIKAIPLRRWLRLIAYGLVPAALWKWRA